MKVRENFINIRNIERKRDGFYEIVLVLMIL